MISENDLFFSVTYASDTLFLLIMICEIYKHVFPDMQFEGYMFKDNIGIINLKEEDETNLFRLREMAKNPESEVLRLYFQKYQERIGGDALQDFLEAVCPKQWENQLCDRGIFAEALSVVNGVPTNPTYQQFKEIINPPTSKYKATALP